MKHFIFSITNEIFFHGQLVSLQCTAKTSNHQQCKRRCVIGIPFCYTHLLFQCHLRIKQSTLPHAGLGLFAVDAMDSSPHVIFKKGQTITFYHGEMINLQQLNARYSKKTAPYTIQINQNKYEDASIKRGVGSIANTKPNHNNATISISNQKAKLVATKNIHNGDEIFLSYGRSFKLNEPNVSHITTTKPPPL